jgi:hypothetical protein
MGSYAGLHIKGQELIWWKNGLSPMIASLFTKDEIHRATGPEGYDLLKTYGLLKRYEDLKPNDIEWEIALAVIDVATLKQRLSIYGYSKRIFDETIDQEILRLKEYIDEPDDKYDLKDHYRRELKKYDSIKNGSISISEMSYKLFEQIDFYNEAAKIWAVIQHKDIDDSDVAVIDLDDLIEGGWLNEELENEDSSFLVTMDDFIPDIPVLITEGVTDKRILEKSLSVIYPKLVSNVKFLDMDFKPENGVSSVVKMVRSFAAAGIRNRILLILDNDSAASEALMTLPKNLPGNIKVVQYPNLEMLKSYPTIGPQGAVNMDVNGLAGSIEMFVGKDVLADKSGDLEVVQWGGYMAKVKKYQGSLLNKEAVLKRFDNKETSNLEDWDDLKFLWDYIIQNLSEL